MAAFAPEDEDALFRSYLCRLNIGAGHQGKATGGSQSKPCAKRLRAGDNTG